MHELSIAESICRSVAERVGTAHVEEMVVQVGALSGVNRDALDFCLGEAAKAAGIELDRFSVEVIPARAACDCGHTYDAFDLLEPCPQCGGYSRTFADGEDVIVHRLVVVEQNGEADGNPEPDRHREE